MTGARAREERMLAARRGSWAARQWRRSEHGNSYLNVRGFNIVVYGTRKGWGIRIQQRYGDRWRFGLKRYATRVEAQAAAFDALLWAEKSWAGNGRYDFATTQGAAT